MNEMKSKEEILNEIIGEVRAFNRDEVWYEHAILAMEEYASQVRQELKDKIRGMIGEIEKKQEMLKHSIHWEDTQDYFAMNGQKQILQKLLDEISYNDGQQNET